MALAVEPVIEGVEIKSPATNADEFFGHFGQWSHSLMYPGVAKACHHHSKQADWRYCIGSLKVALHDLRQDSPAAGELVYDPEDEGRITHDDRSIGYDWTAGPPVK